MSMLAFLRNLFKKPPESDQPSVAHAHIAQRRIQRQNETRLDQIEASLREQARLKALAIEAEIIAKQDRSDE